MNEKVPDLRSPEERREDGTFAPGRSPNPGGQAKWLQPIKADLKAGVPGVLTRLMGIIQNGEDKDAIAAGKVWLDYSLPKPKQTVKVSGNGTASPLATLSLEDLLALGRGVKAAGKEGL